MEGFGLSGFLFGNVNADGELEGDDFLDEEVRKALVKVSSKGKGAFASVSGISSLDLLDDTCNDKSIIGESASAVVTFSREAVVAVDYSEINELAVENATAFSKIEKSNIQSNVTEFNASMDPVAFSLKTHSLVPTENYASTEINQTKGQHLKIRSFASLKSNESVQNANLSPPKPNSNPFDHRLVDYASFKLTKNGRLLRSTKFLARLSNEKHSKYRLRPLTVRKKKCGIRQQTFLEDHAVLFRSSHISPNHPCLPPPKLSYYHKILLAHNHRQFSSVSGLFSESAFDYKRLHKAFTFPFGHDKVSRMINSSDLCPNGVENANITHLCLLDLMDWEKMIVYDEKDYLDEKSFKNVYTPLFAAQQAILNYPLPHSLSNQSANSKSNNSVGFSPSLPNSRPNTPHYSSSGSIAGGLQSRSVSSLTYNSRSMSNQQLSAINSLQNPSSIRPLKSLAGRIINRDFLKGQWESQIIWDDTHPLPPAFPLKLQLNLNDPMLIIDPILPSLSSNTTFPISNAPFLSSNSKFIEQSKYPLKHFDTNSTLAKDARHINNIKSKRVRFDKIHVDRFNISNDRYYFKDNSGSGANLAGGNAPSSGPNDLSSHNGSRRIKSNNRSILSSRQAVQHALPAVKLSQPFYPTHLEKNQLRKWHRPPISLPKTIRFSPLTRAKAAPLFGADQLFIGDEKGKSINENARNAANSSSGTLNSAKKLSLKEENSQFVIAEFSEEHPPLISNPGMAVFFWQCYRKLHPRDIPQIDCPFGSPRILEPNESSPFWSFGDVAPGQCLPMAQNNLYRAPIFPHRNNPCDLLVIKSNIAGQGEPIFYIRPLTTYSLSASILLHGQTLPSKEVYSNHSRRYNAFCHARVQAFLYRLFRREASANVGKGSNMLSNAKTNIDGSNTGRVKGSRISAAFPQFSDASLRKWIKEYADPVRQGKDSGFWRLRPDAPQLNEDDIRQLVTPEMVCQYESMLAGQQRLQDSGLLTIASATMDGKLKRKGTISSPSTSTMTDGNEPLDIVQLLKQKGLDLVGEKEAKEAELLTPWTLTTNFCLAALGKGAIAIFGPGDPSGRGEAFDYSKMGSFHASTQHPPTSVPYRSQIAAVWDAQMQVLSHSEAPANEPQSTASSFSKSAKTTNIPSNTNPSLSNNSGKGILSGAEWTKAADPSNSPLQTLLIKRIVQLFNEDGSVRGEVEQIESITDPRIIIAYLRERKVWERKRKRKDMASAASASRNQKMYKKGGGTNSLDSPSNLSTTSCSPSFRKDGIKRPKSKKGHGNGRTIIRLDENGNEIAVIEDDSSVRRPAKVKKVLHLRCGTCGQVGHMRTNRICPRYAEYEAEIKRIQDEAALKKSAREQVGFKVDGNRISISKSLLIDCASVNSNTLSGKYNECDSHSNVNTPNDAASPESIGGGFNASKGSNNDWSLQQKLQQEQSPFLSSSATSIAGHRKKRRFSLDPLTLTDEQRHALAELNSQLSTIHHQICAIPEGWPFHKPVSKTEYPHYHMIISKPLDFGTIKRRIGRSHYSKASQLVDDYRLVRDNCIQFNGPDHLFSQIAARLVEQAESLIIAFERFPQLESIIHPLSSSNLSSTLHTNNGLKLMHSDQNKLNALAERNLIEDVLNVDA